MDALENPKKNSNANKKIAIRHGGRTSAARLNRVAALAA